MHFEEELCRRHNFLATIRCLHFVGSILHESLLIMILWTDSIGVARNTYEGNTLC